MKTYTKEELEKVLENHSHWYNKDCDGWETMKADLSGANLSGADLSGADLRWANLRWANLSKADLSETDLSETDLSGANLSETDLRWANLSGADLSGANLRWANLSGTDLRWANLSGTDLSGTDLSRVNGILSAIDYIADNFERTEDGIIAYKVFNGNYNPPKSWVIKCGSVLNENVNSYRTDLCGCGVNVAPLEWVKKNYPNSGDIWKCLIRWEWLCGVVVPYGTDGKIRCERVELIEVVKE